MVGRRAAIVGGSDIVVDVTVLPSLPDPALTEVATFAIDLKDMASRVFSIRI